MEKIELEAGTIEYEDTGGALVQLLICEGAAPPAMCGDIGQLHARSS